MSTLEASHVHVQFVACKLSQAICPRQFVPGKLSQAICPRKIVRANCLANPCFLPARAAGAAARRGDGIWLTEIESGCVAMACTRALAVQPRRSLHEGRHDRQICEGGATAGAR